MEDIEKFDSAIFIENALILIQKVKTKSRKLEHHNKLN